MTPTLLGRWQTRIFLFIFAGSLVTLPFSLGWLQSLIPEAQPGVIYFWVLFHIGWLGLLWDILYNFLQKFRWDRDWPAAFQLMAGIWEGLFFFVVVKSLPWLKFIGVSSAEINWLVYLVHYSLVWLAIFTASQTLMRVLFPRWRFKGGELI
ncbi:MAG: hypothetical protein D6756_02195 [Cyanobacteria bacterium J083]|nr:MAG: hypothetical protein D6756_02195 [Cyanobacteria bacterium J083]